MKKFVAIIVMVAIGYGNYSVQAQSLYKKAKGTQQTEQQTKEAELAKQKAEEEAKQLAEQQAKDKAEQEAKQKQLADELAKAKALTDQLTKEREESEQAKLLAVEKTVSVAPVNKKKNLATAEDKSILYSSLSEKYASAIDSKVLAKYQQGEIVSYRDTIDAVFYKIIQDAVLKDAVSLIEKARENWSNYKVEKFKLVMEKPGEKSLLPKAVFDEYKKGFTRLMAKAPRNLSEQSLGEICSLDNILRYMKKSQNELKKHTEKQFKTMFTVR